MTNIVPSVEFSAVFGVNEGYGENAGKFFGSDDIALIWNECANECSDEGYEYISAVINPSLTVYKKEWGCPRGGEATFNVTGVSNPKFNTDDYAWQQSVIRTVEKMKKVLKQTTVMLVFRKVETVYLSDK